MQIGAAAVGPQQIKAVGHVQFVGAAGVFGHDGQAIVIANFAHHGGVGVLVQQRAQLFKEAQILGLCFVKLVILPTIGVDIIHSRVVALGLTTAWVVTQLFVVEVIVGGV